MIALHIDNLTAWMARLEAHLACPHGIVVPQPLVLEGMLSTAQSMVQK